MGWRNPPRDWAEFERLASGRIGPRDVRVPEDDPDAGVAGPRAPRGPVVPYAELHAHSHYSFLDGVSSPAALVAEATRLGLAGLALTDHDGLYGAVQLAEAAERRPGLLTVHGAELSLGLTAPATGDPDPGGDHLVVLARGRAGYHRLAGAITAGQLAGGEKGRPLYDLEELAARGRDHWVVLTGCRKGAVRRALTTGGDRAAARELDRLVALFGREGVLVELIDHGQPTDDEHNEALAALADGFGLATVATNNVHYATPADARHAAVVAAVRARRSLDELDPWLPATGSAHLRSGAETAVRFRRRPDALERTVATARELAFTLRGLRPALPASPVPAGQTPMDRLRELVRRGAARRYPDAGTAVTERLERELAVIEAKDFPGYFLIVHDLVEFARRAGILCQGRGSAANSAVCFVLGITAVDAIGYDLPFERFLSSLREEEPDIDVDFDSGRREEVIQYVYERYGRLGAAQVANVISYRPKNAVRDAARAFGHGSGLQDAWARRVDRSGTVPEDGRGPIPADVAAHANRMLRAPRHLGIHSGGMVLTARPVGEVCPIEHARKAGRTVLQWDKEDCAAMGLVKFDLLGLGMLSALRHILDLVRVDLGERWELASIPKDEPAVYDMLCRADALGVFQVESRAQLNTLPRLRPRCFYDLVIEIALIRPGPIQGGAVHPYLRRRAGREAVTYPHPRLKPVLERTLGIPLFQEQLMQMAVAVGGCTSEDADLLRRAMGSKRGAERVESLRAKLYAGMAANGITGAVADDVYARIQAFADFGFAESHSLSFALLVYASSWLKLHYPAAFLAGLLRSQPMGFYSPASLVADARRHGVAVRGADVLRSGVQAGLEGLDETAGPTGRAECLDPCQPEVGAFDPRAPDRSAEHRRDGRHAVRLGLAGVRGLGAESAERLVAEREAGGAYTDLDDLVRRTGLTRAGLEGLAAAGAFGSLGMGPREALWAAGPASRERPDQLAGTRVSVQPPLLTVPSPAEARAYELWATGISTRGHPLESLRAALERRGVLTVAALATAEPGRRIEVAGVVTHRQRPATAGGVTFLNLEDETGIVGAVASVGVWKRYRSVAGAAPALIVRGLLVRSVEGVVSVGADRFEALEPGVRVRSRDFR